MEIRIQSAGGQGGPGYTQEDSFNEVLIRQRWAQPDYLRLLGIAALTLLLFALSLLFVRYLSGIVALIWLGIGYLSYILFSSQRREYEYIATNGSLDVDLILAQRKRQRIFSAQPGDIESYGRVTGEEAGKKSQRGLSFIDASSRQTGELCFVQGRYKDQQYYVLLDYSEKIYANIRRFSPSKERR